MSFHYLPHNLKKTEAFKKNHSKMKHATFQILFLQLNDISQSLL